jgi:Flp pilus assembly protein TadG
MSHRWQRFRDERGAILIAGLLLSLALLLVIGAAVDIGRAFIVRRELISAADNAALTGSQALDLNALHQGTLALDPAQAQRDALQALALEPASAKQTNATTTLVSVHVERRIPTLLLRLAGLRTLTVTAQANASPRAP